MTQASRPAGAPLFGKNDTRVTTDVSEQTADELSMLARASKMTRAEYIRRVLEEHVHGAGTILSMRLQRLNGSHGKHD